MQKIVLATNNQGKVNELQTLLANAGFDIIAQSQFNIPDADETGLTFIENALLKARHTAKLTGLSAIADDSGLAVDALDGQPGIYSARYAGEHGNDKSNNQKLLKALQNIPKEKRTAYFYCALVFMRHENDPTPIICLGKWDGLILNEEQGDGGFGYDPLFYVPELGCTAAQLTKEQKSQISHRGQALKQLIEKIKTA
ncbi:MULTISPECIES: XTP/dITP diphosphatase [unclassified Gilliamella]|uniref:XTP/dITP diphosphatase n=1 Tax=unclassified Gilliamella TaxID=2685620 RepID=UPI00080ED5C7|nr:MULTISPECIES: XTP/dITP diphosphatase [Gilliamella]MCO6537671.1 XTP/dITP diphosphatase [Gilliamella sp.]MCO6549711.1 XTP/dITP diphosphatase [Gilliamella sp.]OCG34100.1 non-canonical purine NTP pyrophosphatase, RdgB/HAM1 family [Gilliamella apicola]OCG47371.1 non-canonical purine NTP pyrophosphatase, RdgB/HAM1 family [Gilliamella apicola]OCG48761.1 non-canonical purine NTP pyrophosphatase, RdgB/HAM1 family [Gilliamella apicola]